MESPLFHVKCPRCRGRAVFEQPFEFRPETPERERRPVHRWGNWYVVEKYPHVLSWSAPSRSDQGLSAWPRAAPGAWAELVRGVVKCEACHLVAAHDLNWPEDAYYSWRVRGQTLWAWSEEHANVILDFLRSNDRDPARYGEYAYSLAQMPKEFVTAKARDEAVKRITGSLRG